MELMLTAFLYLGLIMIVVGLLGFRPATKRFFTAWSNKETGFFALAFTGLALTIATLLAKLIFSLQ